MHRPCVKNILIVGSSGYVGSRLVHDLLLEGYGVFGCDKRKDVENSRLLGFFHGAYQDLDDSFLQRIDVVLWFAGHSTVKMAQEDPWNAYNNNVSDLLALVKRLREKNIPLIYASSASLYSSIENRFSLTADEQRSNPYDASKLAFDVMLNVLDCPAVGLRMATVAGWAPCIRWETLFNSLNRSAYLNKRINVTNPSNFRGVLFIDDLSEYVLKLIKQIDAKEFPTKPIQVPLSSWSGSIGTMASEIAQYWDAPVEFGADEGTYSFVLTDRHLRQHFTPSKFYKSIAERCNDFSKRFGWK